MTQPKQMDPATLDEIVARIVQAVRPERIVLFGSAARGEMRPGSDLDLLVVKGGVHRRRLAQEIRRCIGRCGRPVDVIVAWPEDLERYGTCPALVFHVVLREGKVLYAA